MLSQLRVNCCFGAKAGPSVLASFLWAQGSRAEPCTDRVRLSSRCLISNLPAACMPLAKPSVWHTWCLRMLLQPEWLFWGWQVRQEDVTGWNPGSKAVERRVRVCVGAVALEDGPAPVADEAAIPVLLAMLR